MVGRVVGMVCDRAFLMKAEMFGHLLALEVV